MTFRRSSNLRRINLTIGVILVIAGVTGGYLLTFWFLMLLLPITFVAASWMMASTVRPGQEAHVVAAMIVTAVFIAWLWYFIRHGAEMLTWYGIFSLCGLLMLQATIYLARRPREVETTDLDLE